jgi:hypothetical protein
VNPFVDRGDDAIISCDLFGGTVGILAKSLRVCFECLQATTKANE